MLKKILIIFALLFLIVVTVFAYYCFWPRHLYRIYGYHDILTENKHCKWYITFTPTGDPFAKVVIYESPYRLNISHDSMIKFDKVGIMKGQNVVLTLDNGERKVYKGSDEENRVLTMYQDIELDYQDYELVIYYSLKKQGNISDGIIKVLLKTDFVEKKVSSFEIALGI